MKITHKIVVFICLTVLVGGCSTTGDSLGPPSVVVPMQVTGYCPCKKCCAWKRNWLGRPVYASGSLKGERKKVGQTASGTMAKPGTIAADTDLYPFGTIMFVPGYGYGRVEDRGGDIRAQRIDVFFKKHGQAEDWGRVVEDVYIWLPGTGSRVALARP